MRELSDRIFVRLSESDTSRLRTIAARAGRTESDLLRTLIRSIDVDHVNLGIPLPTTPPELDASRRKVPA